MPKRDPITGCTVMTTAEFFNEEAEREGKGRCGGELFNDYLDDMEKDRKETEDRYRDPAFARNTLKTAIDQFNECAEPALPQVREVLEVLEASFTQGVRESGLWLRARCIRADGAEDILCYGESSFSGDRINPPDGDSEMYWENLDEDNNPIAWRHLYTIGVGHDAAARRKKCEWLFKCIQQAGIRVRIAKGPFEASGDDLQVSEAHYKKAMEAVGQKILNLSNDHNLFDHFPVR